MVGTYAKSVEGIRRACCVCVSTYLCTARVSLLSAQSVTRALQLSAHCVSMNTVLLGI